MKPRHRKRHQREIERQIRQIFDYSRKNSGPWSDLKIKVTLSQDTLHSDEWHWSVDLHIDYLGSNKNRQREFPGYSYYRTSGRAESGAEADANARSMATHARSVYAELITTIAPPTTISIEA